MITCLVALAGGVVLFGLVGVFACLRSSQCSQGLEPGVQGHPPGNGEHPLQRAA